jgi:hypothetical protein
MEWLQTPALSAGIGVLLVGIAVLIVAASAVCLGLASVWMGPDRAHQALRVLKELRRLTAALRGKAPTSE